MKKLIVSVLLIGMMLSQSVFAAESSRFSDVPSNASYAEAVNTLADMGILNGDKAGRFNPDKTITRAEAAVIICKIAGVADEAAKIKKSSFSDVPSNYCAVGYIAKANELGIISGYSKTKFGPKDTVTYEQFIKMLVCTRGYGEDAKEKGGFPNGYLAVAEDRGIVSDDVVKNSALRGNIAVLVYNAINSPSSYEKGGDI